MAERNELAGKHFNTAIVSITNVFRDERERANIIKRKIEYIKSLNGSIRDKKKTKYLK